MKKEILAILAISLSGMAAGASATYNLMDVPFTVDTLYHATVGPGTTQTSLLFHNDATTIRAFYFTFDVGTPYVRYSGVCAGDRLAGNETVSGMATRKSKPGERYFAGVNGDFFYTGSNSAGKTKRGSSILGTTLGSTVCNQTIYRALTNICQFVVDTTGRFFIDQAVIGGTVTDAHGSQAPLAAFNAEAPANVVTIYNDLYYGSTNELTDDMAEAELRLADGETLQLGKKCRMVVTSAPSTGTDMLIAPQHYVVHGRGDACKQWVSGLQVGDTITVDSRVSVGGENVVPVELLSGWPKVVSGGATLDTESQWYDGATQQPRGSIAYGDGGKKLYFLVVDGRSAISAGVRLRQLGDIMRYAGATEGVNLDGGGSATIYSAPLGVINRPSDGVERADGNGFFAVCTAPDDSTVASIKFVDWKLELPRYGVCTPKFYGYNRYGMLIDTDLKGVRLSCPESIGHIRNDSTLVADGVGCELLTASYGDITVSMPVTVTGGTQLAMRLDSVINDGFRHYAVEVTGTTGDKVASIDPTALTWSSNDQSVVGIGANTGVLTGIADGEAVVTGTVGDFTGHTRVIVERPKAHVMPLDSLGGTSTWTIAQNGGKDGKAEALGHGGLKYTFTGKSSRSVYLKLTSKLRVWSMPDTLRVRLNPGDVQVKSLVFSLRTPGGKAVNVTVAPDSIPLNVETIYSVPTSDWTDALDVASYPITLNYIQVNMAQPQADRQYTMLFNGIEAVYGMQEQWPSSSPAVIADGVGIAVDGTRIVIDRQAESVEVYDTSGRLVASAQKATAVDVNRTGSFVVVVKSAGRSEAAKVSLH